MLIEVDALPSLKHGLTFFDECLGCIAMIFSLSAVNVVCCFQIQTVIDIA